MIKWHSQSRVACVLLFCGWVGGVYAQGIPPPISLPDPVNAGEVTAQSNTVYLETTLNGNEIVDLKEFQIRDGAISARPDVLKSLGFRNFTTSVEAVPLSTIAGLRYEYKQDIQRIVLSAPLSTLDLETTQLSNELSPDIEVSTGTGLLLNYDLYGWYSSERYRSFSAFSELRFFNPLGVLSNTTLFKTSSGNRRMPGERNSVRLDTQWETSWPQSAISLRLGDTHTAALSWSRATRIGGIQLSRNFALQPYFSTAPLPSFLGAADIPSNAELYVNGVKQYENQVPAGPFEIQTMPYISGAGNATLVLTDTMGKQRTLQLPFYSSTLLLKKGLADWSLEAGYVRRSYGLRSFDYGHDPVYSGSIRYGVSNEITAEAHTEGTRSLVNYGAGVSARLGQLGVISGSYSSSRNENVSGHLYSAGYQWQGKHFYVNANLKTAQQSYKDIATLYGAEVPQTNQIISAGVNMGRWGQLGVSWIKLKYFAQQSSRYLNVYWSKQLNNSVNLALNYNKDLGAAGNQTLFLGVSINLEKGYSGYLSSTLMGDNNPSYSASLYKRTQEDHGLSWSLRTQYDTGAANAYASADYLSRYGEYSAGVQTGKGNHTGYLNATGALVLMSGGAFASRQIDDGFAVVSTNGVQNVPVKLENREYGKTNSNGLLIVTPLNAYQRNRVSIDPSALPANVMIDKVDTNVSTQRKSGTRVLFKVAPVSAATVVVQDRSGRNIPLGTQVVLNNSEEAVVGYDGIVYLEKLQRHNLLQLRMQGGDCRILFDYTNTEETIPRLGPLTCQD